MSEEQRPSYKLDFWRAYEEKGQHFRQSCVEDEATTCVVRVTDFAELEFQCLPGRPGEWPMGKARLERMLSLVFGQGRACQQRIIKDALDIR